MKIYQFILTSFCFLFSLTDSTANDACVTINQEKECINYTSKTSSNVVASHPKYHFTTAEGWNNMMDIRTVGDVNGDGKADIIGFGVRGVEVSFAKSNGTYSYPQTLISNLTFYKGGWLIGQHPRMVADVNGDGKADIVGFGESDVIVAFSRGESFETPKAVYKNFTKNTGGWDASHPRMMADVNGDGKADIIAFGETKVRVAFSTGRGFELSTIGVTDFVKSNGWDVAKHIRTMGDVNGDGKADIVGFGNSGVRIALSTGNGFATGKTVLSKKFAINGGGWKVGTHPRMLADVNGDGKDDIIGFGASGVQVALSTGNGFASPKQLINKFGTKAGNWNGFHHVRTATDLNGDGKADIIGFGNSRIAISYSNGTTLGTARNLTFNKNIKEISNISPSRVINTTRGKTIDYNFSRKQFVPMNSSVGKIADMSLNFVPKTAYIDNEGFVYVYLSMKGSTIDMTKYINQSRKKGYYLKDVQVDLQAVGMDEFRNSPLNKSGKGVYTVSDEFTVGGELSEDGVELDVKKTWGSRFATEVHDFAFTNKTKRTNVPKFYWNLTKVGHGIYTNYRSLGVKSAAQYSSLTSLPPLASQNFPIDCEAIFRKDVKFNMQAIPDQVKIRVKVKATFEKTWLADRGESDVVDFLNGFVAAANPRSYAGELLYEFKHDTKVTENYIDVILDMRPYKE